MKVLQVSNFISHHQLPLANAIASKIGCENFKFCATKKLDEDRKKIGWTDDIRWPWILRSAESSEDNKLFQKWFFEADVVLCGERMFSAIEERLHQKKHSFYMSERWWKPPIGPFRLIHPNFFKMAMHFRRLTKSPYFHYLPIGPYAESDISYLIDAPSNVWRWGYFTDLPSSGVLRKKMDSLPVSILWAGRMLGWKKVIDILKALVHASENFGLEFKITLVGDGPERKKLEHFAKKNIGANKYTFLNPMPSNEIHQVMMAHDIYVLPSSSHEGWGAVINEAMSCGCAVIASKGAGAAAAMIENGVNGFLFDPGDWRSLSGLIVNLSSDKKLMSNISRSAQSTIENFWSPSVAANRFVKFSSALIEGIEIPKFSGGPLSRVSLR